MARMDPAFSMERWICYSLCASTLYTLLHTVQLLTISRILTLDLSYDARGLLGKWAWGTIVHDADGFSC